MNYGKKSHNKGPHDLSCLEDQIEKDWTEETCTYWKADKCDQRTYSLQTT